MSVEDVAVKNLRDQSLTGVICIQDSLYQQAKEVFTHVKVVIQTHAAL